MIKQRNKSSLKSQIMRKVLVPFGAKISNEGLMESMNYLLWKCPNHMENQVVELENSKLEILKITNEKAPYAILEIHGGAFVYPFNDAYRKLATRLFMIRKDIIVASCLYRVATEAPFPAALEDVIDGYRYLQSLGYDGQHIIVLGDSAGGGIALSLIHYLKDRDEKLPKGVITFSAWTDLTCSGDSFVANQKTDAMLGSKKSVQSLRDNIYAKNDEKRNPYISPLFGNLKGFPPLLMQVSSNEMLLDDTLRFVDKAKTQGVDVELEVYNNMFHVFQIFYSLKESKEAYKTIESFISKLWPK